MCLGFSLKCEVFYCWLLQLLVHKFAEFVRLRMLVGDLLTLYVEHSLNAISGGLIVHSLFVYEFCSLKQAKLNFSPD